MSSVKEYEEEYLKAFKNHELTILFKDGPSGLFVVKNPKEIHYCYQIMSGPYGLAITGDLDEYTCYTYKSWKWFRGATGDYLAGKMQVEQIVNIKAVRELAYERDDDWGHNYQDLRDMLQRIDDDTEIKMNDIEYHLFQERSYDALGEIPYMYRPNEVGKLNAMTMTFDRLLRDKGI